LPRDCISHPLGFFSFVQMFRKRCAHHYWSPYNTNNPSFRQLIRIAAMQTFSDHFWFMAPL